ncbi:alpha/beta hydrolase [Solirubrobacter ginsenosidimutans]|uniref:Alpha/beta hydrolase n=1 Tax=Solirubrobacter ginsenosidimutans TaxID=490573 RepID=A0A9X3MTR6_9ACTN|nr:alpha/beta hydrolase [Solirubrobacter ginsenosidimutans]MDA0159548.1 alpha/beta hydrolase [Solirubrobacter ginsenosidimutans]
MAARLLVLIVVAAHLMGCGGGRKTDESRPRPAVTLVGVGSGELIDVGGRDIYMECVGSGSPTVLLEAGFGGSSRNWNSVLPLLGRTTRSCAYDRAGLGESDAMPGVHDAGDEIKDLERLLERARIEPPFVLVGHSYGGLLARLFAFTHLDQTGAVVLVDAEGRDAWRRGLAAWPRSLEPKLRRSIAERTVLNGVDMKASAALAASIRSLDDKPLVVITPARERLLFKGLPATVYRRWDRLWRVTQNELTTLSPDHAHVLALGSDHFIQDDQPIVVLQAIRAVVRAVRDHAPLPPCERVFTGPDVRCLA